MSFHNFWPIFFTYLTYSFEIGLIPPICISCLVLCVGLVVSSMYRWPLKKEWWKHDYWLIFTQSLFVPAILCVGVLYQHGPFNPTMPRPTISPIGDQIVEVLYYLSLALGLFWIWRLKGLRWFAFCIVALQEAFILGAMFIAGMSISGDWI